MNDQKRILIIEDEQELRTLYISVLREQGFTVDELSNGLEAVEKIKTGNYDLVLLDIMMPKKNGIDVLEELANDPTANEKQFNIVVLTNLGQDSIIARGVSLKIRGFMIKSDYTPEQFIKEVTEYLD